MDLPVKILLVSLFFTFTCVSQEKKVLVFHKTSGYWHESIPTGFQLIEDLGDDHGFKVDETKKASKFNIKNLKEYDLVIFLNTNSDILSKKQKQAFQDYIEQGGSFFGVHSAAATELDWDWYIDLVGAAFVDHPEVQQADVVVNKPNHPTVKHLPARWTRTDEWYNYENLHPENIVLLSLDESTYTGGTHGNEHPIAWFRKLDDGGVSIYTGLGHTIASYVEPAFVEHILQCILFALEGKDGIK